MKSVNTFSKISFFVTLFCCLLLISCGPNDGMIPLNTIKIPDYTEADYIKLLDNKDPEVVYSAVCNLISNASNYANVLSTDTIKDTLKIIQARIVYSKLCNFLTSDDEWLVCSSLRFFQDFGVSYAQKDSLALNLLNVKLKTKSIKLEFINALKGLYGANPILLESVMEQYVKDDSWLISRYSFQLVPYLFSNELNWVMINKYSKSEEYDKLLIISNIGYSYNDTILNFILNELKTENNIRIKQILAQKISEAKNCDNVIEWLNVNQTILEDIKYPVADYYLNNLDSVSKIRILSFLFSNNLIPDSLILGSKSSFFQTFYYKLDKNNKKESKEVFEHLLKLETLILKNDKYKKVWTDFKITNERSVYSDEFIKKQNALLDEYKKEVNKVFEQNKINNIQKVEYLEKLERLRSEFENNSKK